ncbi:BUD13 homolog [Engraulis encrasicolus]|uniref:BUD13 homolog n=1 Tax=Engraulis encrasicolus TaxID=184585 RepID=UPI002FCEBD7D
MAASTGKATGLSKADYLKRYLSGNGDSKKSKEKKVKKKRSLQPGKGMKIVDDDVDWRQMMTTPEEKENDEEDEAPVVAEVIDERPEEVRRLEAFRTSNKWRIMGDDSGSQDSQGFSNQQRGGSGSRHDSPDVSPQRPARHDSPDVSPPRKRRNDSPDQSPQRKPRHDSPDPSPPRRTRHDSPDVSPPRRTHHDSPDASPPRRARHDSSSPSPPRKAAKSSSPRSTNRSKDGSSHSKKAKGSSRDQPKGHSRDRDLSPPRRRPVKGGGSDSDQSPPRRRPAAGRGSDSDLSPPRKKRQAAGGGSDSDLSPPRRRGQGGGGSDSDLSPPRRPTSPRSQAPQMLSGGAAGLVSLETLRKEQEEIKRRQKQNKPLEEESRNAQTIFRDKSSGKRRDLDAEREEQSRKAGVKAERDEKYAQWGKGLAQSQMQQQNVEDALKEAEKPLARHRDDEELDRMLREQEREGDPMAAMLRKKKAKDAQLKGIKEKPRYKGPQPPPNRFNIMPGYRWDGVDRSNGFEQKRYSRIADKQAVQDIAYQWSVEDM